MPKIQIEQTDKQWKAINAISTTTMALAVVPAILFTLAPIPWLAVALWVVFALAWCGRLTAAAGAWWHHG